MKKITITLKDYEDQANDFIKQFKIDGGEKLMKQQFLDILLGVPTVPVTLNEMIEEYKSLLTEDEYKKLKEYENRKTD